MFKKIQSVLKKWSKKRELEYHKRMLNFILRNAMGMMWCSYILAWFGRDAIAESLSNTITTSVVAITIPYFITKTIENISKYGCRLNKTTKEFDEPKEQAKELVAPVDIAETIDSTI